ncbi:MAG: prephenate dehydrogenase/arogenate dehydrogenase family protein [Thaumarchaeota archaeon]|jgi:prephenate dehydrogenase|nr:prephenate dehydrogenase/arogenate dehydrogenase family protein [Candidatus Terraquivivens yellowstonensis]MCL7392680.1 prephenate dehydrogenase/arogenate dehydrogenase family protein [Candidatus Terraquivivens yellowstonensis]MCL7398310.1 prephenate dehydrogenase/arogenate dehydrogenase family protein [Candidatus Terraquivivens yellowstonensis]MCL7398878.1 prephenate dehydrogenase/arogenate dehydrogenase family protein [Candidatus Terraquivivens yellowstonensis]MCL7400758.1 prephenate dehyd
MKAAIIGAGRMGSWFAKYFYKKGYEVKVFDKRQSAASKLAKEIGASTNRSIEGAVHDADVTLVAVPLDVTTSVVKEVLKYAKQGSVIVEVSSLKAHVVTSLKRLRRTRAEILSVHPLFGPGASDMKGKVMALVPIKSRGSELRIARSIFGDANIIVVNWREHDRAMAYVLSLSHVLATSLIFAMDDVTLKKARRLSGTTFKLQMLSAATSLSENPELVISTFKMNPYAFRAFSSYMKRLNELVKVIRNGDVDKLKEIFKACRAKVGSELYEEAYALLERRSSF